MSNLALLKPLAGALFAGALLFSPSDAAAANPVEECSKELLLSYFPEPFVRETLKKHNIPQNKWDAIVKELNEKDKDVVKVVEEKASKMQPNPLKDPQQRQAAVKIFRETLTDVFSAVLKKNGVNDDEQIKKMLDDVQQQKAKRFAQCMEQQRGKTTQSQRGNPTGYQAEAAKQSIDTKPQAIAPDSAQQADDDDGDDGDGEDDDDEDDDSDGE